MHAGSQHTKSNLNNQTNNIDSKRAEKTLWKAHRLVAFKISKPLQTLSKWLKRNDEAKAQNLPVGSTSAEWTLCVEIIFQYPAAKGVVGAIGVAGAVAIAAVVVKEVLVTAVVCSIGTGKASSTNPVNLIC